MCLYIYTHTQTLVYFDFNPAVDLSTFCLVLSSLSQTQFKNNIVKPNQWNSWIGALKINGQLEREGTIWANQFSGLFFFKDLGFWNAPRNHHTNISILKKSALTPTVNGILSATAMPPPKPTPSPKDFDYVIGILRLPRYVKL